MNLSKNFKYLFFSAITVTALVALSVLTVSAASVDSVIVCDGQINISASFGDLYESYETDNIYLFELAPAQSPSDLTGLTPSAELFSSPDLSFSLPISAGESHRLTHHFVIAAKDSEGQYKQLSDSRYVDNPESFASNTYDYPSFDSKKGLQVQLISDAQDLGISHTVITVPVNSYLSATDDGSCIPISCNFQTFYLNSSKVKLLDHKIRVLSEAGINVFLNIVLTSPESVSEEMSYLYSVAQGQDKALMYALNTDNDQACSCFTAFMSFITDRYTRPDRQYGFAASYIIGYEVNNSRTYNCTAETDLLNYVRMYAKQLRIANTSARSIYSGARIYASVANNFNTPPSDSVSEYPSKAFLDELEAVISSQSDFPWNISVNPYPSDLTNSSVWIDAKAKNDISTEFITMKNIGVFTDYISGESFLYNGNVRRILIGDFGVSGEAGTDSEQLQAASYAYAYYKAVSINSIEAIIYHRQADVTTEKGMYFGMRSALETASGENRKILYNVFKYIDTDVITNSASKDEHNTDFALSLIGAKAWDSVIPGFDSGKAKVKDLYEYINTQESDLKGDLETETLYNFSSGNFYDFYPTDNSEYIEFRARDGQSDKYLYAKMYDTYPQEFMGIGRAYRNYSINSAKYISLKLMAEAPSDLTTVNVVLRITGYGKNKEFITYNATSQITNREWTDVYFNIGSFISKCVDIKSMKILIKAPDSASHSGGYALCVKSIDLLYSKGVFKVVAISVISSAAVISAALITVAVIRKKRSRSSKSLNKRKA